MHHKCKFAGRGIECNSALLVWLHFKNQWDIYIQSHTGTQHWNVPTLLKTCPCNFMEFQHFGMYCCWEHQFCHLETLNFSVSQVCLDTRHQRKFCQILSKRMSEFSLTSVKLWLHPALKNCMSLHKKCVLNCQVTWKESIILMFWIVEKARLFFVIVACEYFFLQESRNPKQKENVFVQGKIPLWIGFFLKHVHYP